MVSHGLATQMNSGSRYQPRHMQEANMMSRF